MLLLLLLFHAMLPQLLQQSPYAEDLFADPSRGKLWLEQEQQDLEWRNKTQPWTWISKVFNSSAEDKAQQQQQRPIWRLAKPVLQQLLAARTMPLQEVGYY
jgi:hypothetical protein